MFDTTTSEGYADKDEIIQLYVYKRPNMFKVQESYFNLVGYGELEKMFTIPNYKTDHEELTLYFPERFLNIVEQRKLPARCVDAGYKKVTIDKHSVYIIQCVKSDQIGIFDQDLPTDESFKNSHDDIGLPSPDEGLQVVGGSINGS